MFGKLKNKFGKEKESIKILAPLEGEVIPLSEVNDPTFAEEVLGKGVAIKPSGGRIVSPVNGTLTQMFDTGHAVVITSDSGSEVLIHVGLDTVRLKGEHYTKRAAAGDSIKIGQTLMEFDREAISAAGYDTVTPVIICNTSDYKNLELKTGQKVQEGAEIIILEK